MALLLFVIATAAGVAWFVRWQANVQQSGFRLTDAADDLNVVERLALQNYLANRVDLLQEPAGAGTEPALFTVETGQTAAQITDALVQAGLLNDRELFLNYLRFYGLDARLTAGTFLVDPQWTIPHIADTLSDTFAQTVEISFLPGLRLEEMAAYLDNLRVAQIDGADFLALTQRRRPFDTGPYPFLASLPADASLQGYLMPGSYRIPPYADAELLVQLMLERFDEQVTPAMRQAYGAQGLSLRDAVILASIVAREAVVEAERPLIASVFHNRVRAGMPLQADPTVQYALGYQPQSGSWWKVPLTLADLQVDHPYNTYVIDGLPPGPIANPGLASLRAVAEPAASDYLFFVLDCTNPRGEHIFSATFEEHLRHVQRCQ